MTATNGPSQVRTVEIFASLALCFLCAKFALGVIWAEVRGYKTMNANKRLSSLAAQMADIEPISSQRKSAVALGRRIASVGAVPLSPNSKTLRSEGVIGTDPWGKPFAYKYFRDGEGRLSFLVLVSGGKNSRIETQFADLNFSQLESGGYNFSGDDFGYIKKIDNRNK